MLMTEKAERLLGPPYRFIGGFEQKEEKRGPKVTEMTRNHCSQRSTNPRSCPPKPAEMSRKCGKEEKFMGESTLPNSETGRGAGLGTGTGPPVRVKTVKTV